MNADPKRKPPFLYTWRGVLLVLVVLLAMFLFVFFKDEKLEDDTDLLPIKKPITIESPALLELRAQGKSFDFKMARVIEEDFFENDVDLIHDMRYSATQNKSSRLEWSNEEIDVLLDRHQRVLEKIKSILINEEIIYPSNVSFSYLMPEIRILLKYRAFFQLKMDLFFKEENYKAALDLLKDQLLIFNKQKHANAPMSYHMMMQVGCLVGLNYLKKILPKIDDHKSIDSLAFFMGDEFQTEVIYPIIFKQEYRMTKEMVLKYSYENFLKENHWEGPRGFVFNNLFYRKNKTLNGFMGIFRKHVSNINTHLYYSTNSSFASKKYIRHKIFNPHDGVTGCPCGAEEIAKEAGLINNNYAGINILINIGVYPVQFYSDKKRANKIVIQQKYLLIALALRAYYIEHHKMPGSIQTLVPKYLKEIPIERSLKMPYQYSKERLILALPYVDISLLPKLLSEEDRKALIDEKLIFELNIFNKG